MKVYTCQPGSDVLKVSDGRRIINKTGALGWGDGLPPSINLARLLLEDIYGKDAKELRMLQPFKWRVVQSRPKEQPFAVTEDEAREQMASIMEGMKDRDEMIKRQMREKPMVPSEPGAPSAAWDNAPEPRKK